MSSITSVVFWALNFILRSTAGYNSGSHFDIKDNAWFSYHNLPISSEPARNLAACLSKCACEVCCNAAFFTEEGQCHLLGELPQDVTTTEYNDVLALKKPETLQMMRDTGLNFAYRELASGPVECLAACSRMCEDEPCCTTAVFREDTMSCTLYDQALEQKTKHVDNSILLTNPITQCAPNGGGGICSHIGTSLGHISSASCDTMTDQTSLAIEHGPISKVTIYHGLVVDGITFTYGTHQGPLVGDTGGSRTILTLDSDEAIKEVDAQLYQPGYPHLHYGLVHLNFVTSKNRRYGPYGVGSDIIPNSFMRSTGGMVLSFQFGVCTGVLKRLTPVFNTC